MNYVDGVYCPPINEQYFDNINPATGEVYCLIPDSDDNDLALAVTAAEKHFQFGLICQRKNEARF